MPSVLVRPPSRQKAPDAPPSPLPPLLHTPAGLAILEIQGVINMPTGAHEEDPPSQACPVGKLVFPHYHPSQHPDDTSWHKRVYLYVGKHQRLTGEVKKLTNPLAILRPQAVDATTSENFEIAAVVGHKLLFTQRPEPVGGGGDDNN